MEIVDKYWREYGGDADMWTAKKEDHEVLIKLIEKFNLTSFFEIGAYTAFTAKLLSSHPNIKRWKSIDTNPRDAHPNIIKGDIVDYKPTEQYDLIFIDGDHCRVERDTIIALKFNPVVIAWHDYVSESDVRRDVDFYQPVNVEANIAWKK